MRAKGCAAVWAFALCGTGFAASADARPHMVVLVTTISDAPLPHAAEQRMLADIVGPLHVRLDRVHHRPRYAAGRSVCAEYPKADAVLSLETRVTLRAAPARPWPALAQVPAVRWTPRDVDVSMRYAITSCGARAAIASDRAERRYDAMTMHESDDRREADAIVLTAASISPAVGERWSRMTAR